MIQGKLTLAASTWGTVFRERGYWSMDTINSADRVVKERRVALVLREPIRKGGRVPRLLDIVVVECRSDQSLQNFVKDSINEKIRRK
jgi:hypothetical protein